MRWTATAILATLVLCMLAIAPMGALAQAKGSEDKTGDAAGKPENDREIRPYIEYNAGLSMVRNQNLCCATDRSGTPVRIGGHYETEMPGWVVGGAVGARFLDFLRSEVNLSWRQSNVDRMPLNGGPSPASGDVSLFAATVNVYGDLDLDWPVTPWAGLGIGYGLISLDAESDYKTTPGAVHINAEESVFVWNVMAGVTYPFSEVTEFSFGYRYLATTDPNYNARIEGVDPVTTANPNGRGRRFLKSEFDAHELTAGVRFNF